MRYVLLMLAGLVIASPAFANGHHLSDAQNQANLDRVRSHPTSPTFTDATKNHIIETIKHQCPACN